MKIEIVGAHATCAPCRKLKDFLISNEIEFSFYDMADEPTERYVELTDTLRSKGVRKIPALFLNGFYQEVETAQDVIEDLIKSGAL